MDTLPPVPVVTLLRFRETWGIIGAKFLTDAAWYFYMFWLPKYLLDARGFDIKAVGAVAWMLGPSNGSKVTAVSTPDAGFIGPPAPVMGCGAPARWGRRLRVATDPAPSDRSIDGDCPPADASATARPRHRPISNAPAQRHPTPGRGCRATRADTT